MSCSITPKTTRILTKVFSTSDPNLVALAWTVDELSCGQAENGVNFDFEVKFDLEGQGQSPPKPIGILTKVFYTYGPNLVILAWTGDELSHGQTWWQTDWRTDGQTQATTIPEGQYWPRVKMIVKIDLNLITIQNENRWCQHDSILLKNIEFASSPLLVKTVFLTWYKWYFLHISKLKLDMTNHPILCIYSEPQSLYSLSTFQFIWQVNVFALDSRECSVPQYTYIILQRRLWWI